MHDCDWPEGYSKHILVSVDSTLSEAKRRASEIHGPHWILAHEQTLARGRRGRSWSTAFGNFAATLVLPDAGTAAQCALRSFIAALALHEACVAVSGYESSFALKWPNDVLLNGGKLAGILLENISPAPGVSYLAIGIGVNLLHAPDVRSLEEGALPPVSLKNELSVSIAPEEFLNALARAFARFEEQFQSYGFEPIRIEWMSKAARLGEMISARTLTQSYRGIFQEVDASGQLVLQTDQGRIAIPAADVYF